MPPTPFTPRRRLVRLSSGDRIHGGGAGGDHNDPMPPRKAAKKPAMTKTHKAALAVGRNEARAVRNYLEALEANRPQRGRKRTTETIERRLAAIEDALTAADPLRRLHLLQERVDLNRELGAMNAVTDMADLEAAFVDALPGYSERRGITYAVWREAGVPAALLKQAGISRSR